MKNRHPQKGNSDVILIFTFVLIFILAIVGLPKLLKWKDEAKVPAEVRVLRQIHAAETKYRTQISLKDNYADFRTLTQLKVLPECKLCAENAYYQDGMTFSLERNYDETKFCIRSANYAMGEDGEIYEGASCAMGEVTGNKSKKFTGGK